MGQDASGVFSHRLRLIRFEDILQQGDELWPTSVGHRVHGGFAKERVRSVRAECTEDLEGLRVELMERDRDAIDSANPIIMGRSAGR